jgi:hypothetical protein
MRKERCPSSEKWKSENNKYQEISPILHTEVVYCILVLYFKHGMKNEKDIYVIFIYAKFKAR